MPRSRIYPLMVKSIQALNEEKRLEFLALGNGGHYTQRQKDLALNLIHQSGIRATARILKIPRRTLQRWCRVEWYYIPHCPDWVYAWAVRRRKRRQFWQRRGYY